MQVTFKTIARCLVCPRLGIRINPLPCGQAQQHSGELFSYGIAETIGILKKTNGFAEIGRQDTTQKPRDSVGEIDYLR